MSGQSVALTGGLVASMDQMRTVYWDGFVLIDRGKIVDIGSGRPPDSTGAVQIDLNGAIVLPGFVNTHSHLSESLLRGIGPDSPFTINPRHNSVASRSSLRVDRDDIYVSTLISCAELIRSGVTTTTDSLLAWKGRSKSIGALNAAHDSWLRVVHTVAFLDRTTMVPAGHQFSPIGARSEFESLKSQFEYGMVTVGSEILSLPRASDELITTLRHSGEGIHAIHLPYSEEYANWAKVEYGYSAIEHLDELGMIDDQLIGAHPIYLDDKEIDIYARRGASAAFCAVSNKLIGTKVPTIRRLREASIKVGLGLDYPNHGHNMFETMKMSVLTQKSLELDAGLGGAFLGLELATIEGAKALGLDDVVGSLEVGKKADLIVIDQSRVQLNPPLGVLTLLVYSGTPDLVSDVMVEGRWVMRNRQIRSFDESEVIKRASDAQRRVIGIGDHREVPLTVPELWRLV